MISELLANYVLILDHFKIKVDIFRRFLNGNDVKIELLTIFGIIRYKKKL